MTVDETPRSGWPKGWLASCIGGVIGALGGGLLGVGAGMLYVNRYQDGGLEDLFSLFIGLLVGGFIGAVFGAALSLKVRRYGHPVASGLLFGVIAAFALAGFVAIAHLGASWAVTDAVAIAGSAMTPVGAAVLSRKVVLAGS